MTHHVLEPFPVISDSFNPVTGLFRAGGILFICLLVGLFIPGVGFRLTGTFDENDIVHQLDKINPPSSVPQGQPGKRPREVWKSYKDTISNVEGALASVDQRLFAGAASLPAADVAALTRTRQLLQSQLDELRGHPPIRISGYYLDTLMLVWPIFYACIAWLIFLFAPKCPQSTSLGSRLLLFAGVFVLYRWPTWARNLPSLRYYKRLVYANGNWDISPSSFVVQELQAVLACILIVWLWVQWADFFPYWRNQINTCWPSIASGRLIPEFLEKLSTLFVVWQVCSVILAGAFLPYTFFFWTYVIDYGDHRYLAHAIIMHLLWGVTWLLLTLPLAWTWYQWTVRYRLHSEALQRSAPTTAQAAEAETSHNIAQMAIPIGSWNIVGSVAGALLTFGFPIIKEFLKHFA